MGVTAIGSGLPSTVRQKVAEATLVHTGSVECALTPVLPDAWVVIVLSQNRHLSSAYDFTERDQQNEA